MEKCDQDTPEGWDLEYSGEPYQDRIKNDREYWKKFLDECIDHSKPLRILEFGCGIGDYANYLREKGVISKRVFQQLQNARSVGAL